MVGLAVSLFVVVADQLTKIWVRDSFVLHECRPVISGFFEFNYLRNTGAVWGIMQNHNEWLAALSVVVLALIVVFYRWLVDNVKVHRIALGLMMGGVIGNLIDRVKFGWVTDFLYFHWRQWHWPSFNIADAAICCGVGLYFLSSFLIACRTGHPSTSTPNPTSRESQGSPSHDLGAPHT